MEHFGHKRWQVFSYVDAHCTHVKCIHLLGKNAALKHKKSNYVKGDYRFCLRNLIIYLNDHICY